MPPRGGSGWILVIVRARGVTRGIALSAAAAMIVIGACSHYGRGRRGKNGGRAERAEGGEQMQFTTQALWISLIRLHPQVWDDVATF